MTTKPEKSRELVLRCLTDILERGRKSNIVLSDALDSLPDERKKDRAFVMRNTLGVLERLLTIDAGVNVCSSVPVEEMKPAIREIIRLSAYQILYMDRVPDRAAINEGVNLAKRHGFGTLSGFVNGVLRAVSRNPGAFEFSDPERAWSMPSWIIEKWEAAYGHELTMRMLEHSFDVRDLSMHVMMSRTDPEEVIDSLATEGVMAEKSSLSDRILLLSGCDKVSDLPAFSKGLMFAQDLGSSLVGEAAGIQKGDLVIDVCAAPGGKSMDAADRLNGSGLVISRDRSREKTALIEENKERLSLFNIDTEVWDARNFDGSLEEKADIVIADLPCSGLGDIAKRPEIKYRASEEKCGSLILMQREILSAVWRYVKPGGRLIYSTCTVNREENEDQREWLLSNFPFHAAGLNFKDAKFSEKETLSDGYLQLLPGIDPADGFFLSVFVRE